MTYKENSIWKCRRIPQILAILGIFLGLTLNAYAFKVDTHVWIGQQIINDLADDGMLSIQVGEQVYPVAISPDVKNAVLGNQAVYRMGNIGPDAFPDILSGQTAVHPGAGGWETDDWLSWIKSGNLPDDAKAFSYGYLAHAAADTFAHTYVNAYAGDIFGLFDGEIDVETRHIVLESFIAQRTPPLLDVNGVNIGSADQVINAPVAFLRDRLILNDAAADQNSKSNMYHLYLVHKLKGRLQDFIDGPLVGIEILGTQMAVKIAADIALNNSQAQQVLRLSQRIHDLLQNEIVGGAIDELQNLNNQFVDLNVKLVRQASSAAIKVNNEILNAQANLLTLNGNLIVAANKINSLQAQLTDAQFRLLNTAATIAKESCRKVCSNKWARCGIFWGWGLCWEEVCDTACDTIQVANDAFTQLQQLVASLHSQIDRATSDRDVVKKAMRRVADTEAALVRNAVDIYNEQLRIQNDLLNAAIDIYQVVSADINPVRALLQNWIDDIDSGMHQYIAMSAEVIKATMVPNGNPFDPISKWTCQWGIALVGVPSALTAPGCSTVNRVENILVSVDKILAILSKIDPLSAAVQHLKDRLLSELTNLAKDVGYEMAEKLTGVDVRKLIGIIQRPGSDAAVNAVFAVDNSGKFLLKIPDIAARVTDEMAMTQQGYFDPNRYAVISNAVTLAKLSLLNSQQLNDLVTRAGLSAPTIYRDGTPLYGVTPDNILVKALRNIDGDYQWMGKAPPYPRQAGHLVSANENNRLYGYLFDGKRGMRIWNDPQATDRVFRAIFKGPMNPGLALLLPAEYPYRPCPANPFPLSVYDQTCVGGALDDDGLPDAWELSAIGTLAQGPTDDPDEDGLTNAEEYRLVTNPIVGDTDSDGIPDGTEGRLGYNPLSASEGQLDADGDGLVSSQEIVFGSNPMVADTDGDGLSDGREFQFKTNPLISDTDGDGMGDSYEVNNGLNPISESDKFADLDSDGLANFDEFTNRTNPQLADTDGDGVTDRQERLSGTNPLLAATEPCKRVCGFKLFGRCRYHYSVCTSDGALDKDTDGLTTLQEFTFGSDPLIADTEGDGLPDGQEFSLGTIPTRTDSDGDGVSDGAEVAAGTDPLNSKSF